MTNASSKPASLADIAQQATRAERTVRLCVAGHLNARHDELEQKLQRLVRESGMSDSLDDSNADARRAVAEEMETVRAQMLEHEHEFTFRALPDKTWSDLTAEHPPREDKREAFNVETFPIVCVAASLAAVNGEPTEATVADLQPLWELLNVGQRGEMFDAAWEANTGRVSVPFSALASATLRSTAAK